jgi:hypothetical protein
VQDSADEDSIAIHPVDDDVLPLLGAPVSWPDLVASTAHLRSLNQTLEAIVKAIEVALCLAHTPFVHGVIGNLDQVEPGEPRKRIAGQLLHRSHNQSPSANPFANLAHHVAFGHATLFARQNGGSQGLKLHLVFPFVPLQRPQTRPQHFTCIGVLAALDASRNVLIHLWG